MSAAVSTIKCAVSHWSADQAATIGAALAFYCAFSIAPLLVILLAVAGWIVGAEAAFGHLSSQLTALFGKPTAEILLQAMRSSQTPDGTIATIVSIRHAVARRDDCVRCAGVRAGADLGRARARSQGISRLDPRADPVVRPDPRGRLSAVGLAVVVHRARRAARSDRPPLHRVRGAGGRAGLRDLDRARDRVDRADLSLHAGAPHGVAADPVGRARHGIVVPPRTLGHRVVSRPLDAAFGVRRGSFVRGDAAVAVLLRADLSARRGIHRVHRRRARCTHHESGRKR